MLRRMPEDPEEVWIPLVDEPIGSIVARIQEQDEEITRLVGTRRRILPFRTFAYIRVGVLLGRLLVEHDLPEYDGTETWIEALLRDPAHHARVRQEQPLRAQSHASPTARNQLAISSRARRHSGS